MRGRLFSETGQGGGHQPEHRARAERRLLVERVEQQAVLCLLLGGRPTADWMFSTAYEAGVPWNDAAWEHEKFNKLLKVARAELDESRRRAMYTEMQQIVRNEGGTIIPMFASYVFATSEKLALSDQIASNWDLDGERWMERAGRSRDPHRALTARTIRPARRDTASRRPGTRGGVHPPPGLPKHLSQTACSASAPPACRDPPGFGSIHGRDVKRVSAQAPV